MGLKSRSLEGPAVEHVRIWDEEVNDWKSGGGINKSELRTDILSLESTYRKATSCKLRIHVYVG